MLKLRALEPEDLEQLYAIENNLDDWDYSCMNAPFSHYALRDYIANQHCDLTIDQQVRNPLLPQHPSCSLLVHLKIIPETGY